MSVRRIRGALLAPTLFVLAVELSVGLTVSGQEPSKGLGDGAASTTPQIEPAPRVKAPHPLGSPGKPVAPIAIDYDLSAPPQLGVPFDVQITLAGRDGIADLALAVHADDGLVVGTPQPTSTSADGARGTWTIAATAYKDGTSYLGVLAQGTIGDQHPSRELVIPIRVGMSASTEEPSAAAPSSTRSSQRVIVLPSEDR
jgi:hypothetical protein